MCSYECGGRINQSEWNFILSHSYRNEKRWYLWIESFHLRPLSRADLSMAWKYWPSVDCNRCPLPKKIKKISHSTGPQWPGGSTLVLQGRRESTQWTKRRKVFFTFSPFNRTDFLEQVEDLHNAAHTQKNTTKSFTCSRENVKKNDEKRHSETWKIVTIIAIIPPLHYLYPLSSWIRKLGAQSSARGPALSFL